MAHFGGLKVKYACYLTESATDADLNFLVFLFAYIPWGNEGHPPSKKFPKVDHPETVPDQTRLTTIPGFSIKLSRGSSWVHWNYYTLDNPLSHNRCGTNHTIQHLVTYSVVYSMMSLVIRKPHKIVILGAPMNCTKCLTKIPDVISTTLAWHFDPYSSSIGTLDSHTHT